MIRLLLVVVIVAATAVLTATACPECANVARHVVRELFRAVF